MPHGQDLTDVSDALSKRIAPHLPFLRRYARSVTGAQQTGDIYVASMLDVLLEDPTLLPEASSDRIALYRMVARPLSALSMGVKLIDAPYAWKQDVLENITLLPAISRQAFFLVSVENFTIEQTAEILDVPLDRIRVFLSEASLEISKEVPSNILIIEDEPLIAMDIEQMAVDLGHSIAGMARTKKQAVKLFRETSPDIVLSDIALADGSSGMDAVHEIQQISDVPVIFITGLPESLLTGEGVEPTFVVTKPFDPAVVKTLISQALYFKARATKVST